MSVNPSFFSIFPDFLRMNSLDLSGSSSHNSSSLSHHKRSNSSGTSYSQSPNLSSHATSAITAAPISLPHHLTQPQQQEELHSLHEKLVEARASYRDMRARNKDQGRKARQLLSAVAHKLQEKEEEMLAVINYTL